MTLEYDPKKQIGLELLSMCQRVILRHWKGNNNPTYKEMYSVLSEMAMFERLICKIDGLLTVYEETWEPFLNGL